MKRSHQHALLIAPARAAAVSGGLLGFILLLLPACGLVEVAPSPTAEPYRFQITPIVLTLTFAGACEDDPALLEAWLGPAAAVRENLAEVLARVTENGRQGISSEIEVLVTMRNGVASLAAPDCAAQAHALLVSTIDLALSAVQRYANQDIESIEEERAVIQAQLGQLQSLHRFLTGRLEEIIDEKRREQLATPAAEETDPASTNR